MSRQREAEDQTDHLKHLQGQLVEALAQEEILDEERSLLKSKLDQAQSEVLLAARRVEELDALRPQLVELETRKAEISERLTDSQSQTEDQRQLAQKHSEALQEALDREELIKARSVELAEAVSNLAARVDLLEGETKSQLEALAQLENARDEAIKSQREEAVLCKSLRQQLDDAQTQLANRQGDSDRQRLRAEISLLEERCDAAMNALQHQGAESAKHEQQHRQIELENQRLRASITARKEEPAQRVAEMQQRIRNLDEEGQRLEGELSSLRTRSEEQRQQLDEAIELNAEIETLRSDRSALSAEVERLLPFEKEHEQLTNKGREHEELAGVLEERLTRSEQLGKELQQKLETSQQETDQARQDGEAQVRAALSEQQKRLAEAEGRVLKAQKRSEMLLEELTASEAKHGDLQHHQSQLADKSDLLAALADAQKAEIERDQLQTKSSDTKQDLAQVQLSLSNLEAEFERANDRWAAKRLALEEHHDEELKTRLAQAGDISQAQIGKLESELTKQRSRAAAIEAQEEHIVQLIDEQRQAADQAWSLAVAERNARFVSLVDRFGRVVQTISEKEGHS
jgi:chromosome segregation ATPase